MSAYDVAAAVVDPELPMLTLADLGVLRSVDQDGHRVTVRITPTYAGCPALAAMRADLRRVLGAAGYEASIEVVLAPPWSTDWISERGRTALREHGVSPPGPAPAGPVALNLGPVRRAVSCPQCGADDVESVSEFGATACTALYRCRACAEPFAHVKER